MNYLDMKQAVKLLANEWNLGKKECGAKGDICAWIYLFSFLAESEKIVIHKEGKILIGLGGYSKNNSKRHLLRKKFYTIIKKQLYKSKDIKDLNALMQYDSNYSYLPNELGNHFDGELSLLIVNKNHRGKNIGKKMLLEIFSLASKDGLKNLMILTDESCNFKFYESCGCKKVYETIVKNQEYGKLGKISTEKAYIYEKGL